MAAIQVGRSIPPIDWHGVPVQYKGKCSAVCRSAEDCAGLVRWFGDPSFAPFLPVIVLVPGADAPTLIAGFGYATAAELQDCAVVTWHQQTERLQRQGALLNFDELRERRGLLPRDQVDSAVRQAMLDRIARHKANPISDPFRKPLYPNPNQRTLHPITAKGAD